jgi:DNA polymerase
VTAASPDGRSRWLELADEIPGCTACPELVAGRTQVVVGVAPLDARLVLVGEAPGAQEDASGVPFVGRAGQLLDQLLADAGLDRQQLAVLNVLKCRPPGNRKPATDEVERCRPWLSAQLEALAPQLVVSLGLSATAWFLGKKIQIGQVRGRVHEVDGRRVLPTYHPSGALRFGPAGAPMQALRSDLQLAAKLLASEGVASERASQAVPAPEALDSPRSGTSGR